jgi:SAM-dependent methyltransferase
VARKILDNAIHERRVRLHRQDAQKLDLNKRDFDAAFLCWFLEHVPNPLTVLKRIRRHLRPGAKIYCTEVFNQTLFMEPYSPAYLKYWFEFNDLQYSINGHPFVGAQLGNLLKAAGFSDIQIEMRPFHFDAREPEKRAAFTDYFYHILLSAEPALLKSGRVDKKLIAQVKKEVELVKRTPDAVFFYAFIRATARA